MDWITVLFLGSLACVAFGYAAVGHGGASGYISVFALFGMISPTMKSFVLLMNLAVASLSFYQYYKQGHFNLKYFLPFGLVAAPMAYIGASLQVDALLYKYILACFLIFSVFYLLGFLNRYKKTFQIGYSAWIAIFMAMLIGFISGVTGVGGGIFLSPILLILGWLNVKQTAAVSALFIVLNSLAGLLAIQNFEVLYTQEMLIKLLMVMGFGYLGSRWGVHLENTHLLKRMLALVLFVAAIKLCFV
jgi:uncharacterized membrane protein YfcA